MKLAVHPRRVISMGSKPAADSQREKRQGRYKKIIFPSLSGDSLSANGWDRPRPLSCAVRVGKEARSLKVGPPRAIHRTYAGTSTHSHADPAWGGGARYMYQYMVPWGPFFCRGAWGLPPSAAVAVPPIWIDLAMPVIGLFWRSRPPPPRPSNRDGGNGV